MLEKSVEERLKNEVEKLGCQCWKFVSPGRNGVPDRIIICPDKILEWAETKKPGGNPEPLQRIVHLILGRLGWKVWLIDSYEKVNEFTAYLKKKMDPNGL